MAQGDGSITVDAIKAAVEEEKEREKVEDAELAKVGSGVVTAP